MEVVFANFKIMLIHEVKRHLKLNSADQMTEVYKHSRCLPGTKREERRGKIFSKLCCCCWSEYHLVDGKM